MLKTGKFSITVAWRPCVRRYFSSFVVWSDSSLFCISAILYDSHNRGCEVWFLHKGERHDSVELTKPPIDSVELRVICKDKLTEIHCNGMLYVFGGK